MQTTKTSIFGAYYLLGLARRTGCKILQASTNEVYGDPDVHPQPEEYWGNGYAAEASRALIERAFDELNVEKIYASYRCENAQSKRVLEKLGFEYYSELTNENYMGEFFREIAMVLEK